MSTDSDSDRSSSADRHAPVKTAPEPIIRIWPIVPVDLKSTITRPMQVEIMVHVDDAGRVTGAEARSSDSTVSSSLKELAASTAKLWKFRPALQNGRPVAGETAVQFNFSPDR